MNRLHVILAAPRRVHDFCVFAKGIAQCLSQDPLFSPPPSLLTALESSVLALEATLVAAHARTAGTAAVRKARQKDVLVALQSLQAYVQSLTDAHPLHEAAMVPKRAGMGVKDAKGPRRGSLTVKQGLVSGTARAYAPAAKIRASYEWQYAPEGEGGISLPRTAGAETTLEGLVPGALYWVRVRSLTRDGTSEWSEPVSFRVE